MCLHRRTDRIGLWNTRRLNKADKQHELQIFLHSMKISMFGLLETRVKRAKAISATLNICKDWSLVTNYNSHPGGRIWIIWKPTIYNLNISRITEQLIHCQVEHKGTGHAMEISMVYGMNDGNVR